MQGWYGTEIHLCSINFLLLYHDNLEGLFFTGFLLPNSRTGPWLPEAVSLAGERVIGINCDNQKQQ